MADLLHFRTGAGAEAQDQETGAASVSVAGSVPGCNTVMTPRRGGGRPRGSRNKRSLPIEMLMAPMEPGALHRLRQIINDPKEDTGKVLSAIGMLLAYRHGRPVDRREVSGPGGAPIASAAVVETRDVREEARLMLTMLNERATQHGEAPVVPPEALR